MPTWALCVLCVRGMEWADVILVTKRQCSALGGIACVLLSLRHMMELPCSREGFNLLQWQ